MSFLFGSNIPQVTSTAGEQYLQDPSQQVAGGLQGIAGQPYQPYGGPRIAPETADQLAAYEATRQQQGIAGLGMEEAMGMTRGAAGAVQPGEIQQYMDPYMQNVAGLTADEMRRRYEIERQGMRTQATMAGAWGGGRHAIQEAEGERGLGANIAQMYADQYSKAWQGGLSAAERARQRQMGGGLQLGTQMGEQQAGQYRDISSLGRIGEAQQAQTQQNLAMAYQDFERQRDYPKEQMSWMTEQIARLRAPGAGEATVVGGQKEGAFGPIAGLGIAALSAFT